MERTPEEINTTARQLAAEQIGVLIAGHQSQYRDPELAGYTYKSIAIPTGGCMIVYTVDPSQLNRGEVR